MPIFEFECKECGKTFEVFLCKREEEEKIKCKYCGSSRVEKIMSAVYCKSEGRFSSKSGCAGCRGGNCKTCH